MKTMWPIFFVTVCALASDQPSREVWLHSQMKWILRPGHDGRPHVISNEECGAINEHGIPCGNYTIPWLDGGNGITEVWRLSDSHVLIGVTTQGMLGETTQYYTQAIPIFAKYADDPAEQAARILSWGKNYGLERHGRKIPRSYIWPDRISGAIPLSNEREEKLLGEAQHALKLIGKKPTSERPVGKMTLGVAVIGAVALATKYVHDRA